MESILKNAYFSKLFITKNNKIVIFWNSYNNNYRFITEDGTYFITDKFGKAEIDSSFDITKGFDELYDEEKISILADNYALKGMKLPKSYEMSFDELNIRSAYIAGFEKCIELSIINKYKNKSIEERIKEKE